VAIYCYEGAGLILSLEGSVSKDLRGSFKTIFLVAMIIVTSLYVGFGVCGYLSFGPDTEDIITLNLPGGLFPFLVKGFLCFSLYFTYPIMMFPVTTVLERMFFSQGTADTNYLLGVRAKIATFVICLSPSLSADIVCAAFCTGAGIWANSGGHS
jgi:proton-coupled amino acid transporter